MTFDAPWGATLTIWSLIGAIALLCVPVMILYTGQTLPLYAILLAGVLPLLILAGTLATMIRGYTLTDDTLIIHRLAWGSKLDLAALQSVAADERAMSGSIRLWGNGGLFSITGRFYNHRLGHYRAYATHPRRSVVLKFKDKTVVITPDHPDVFVETLKTWRKV